VEDCDCPSGALQKDGVGELILAPRPVLAGRELQRLYYIDETEQGVDEVFPGQVLRFEECGLEELQGYQQKR